MKNLMLAMLLVLGVSVIGSVLACDGSTHSQSKAGANKQTVLTPAPSTAK